MSERAAPLDLVCMGRAAVDLYGEQIGGRLEDMQIFAKYLGGSPANTAVGVARLGLKPAMLTRVGDEHNGRFVRETLAAEGVDVTPRHDRPEAAHRAGLPRHPRPRDLPAGVLPRALRRHGAGRRRRRPGAASPRRSALLLSGTHLSQPRHATTPAGAAMRAGARAGTRIVLDIDYRPVLWGLTSPGLGEQRFVASERVSAHAAGRVADCDLVVGTEEEIHIAGGSSDTLAALRRLRELTAATLVVKRGPMGCVVFEGAIPDDIEDGLKGPGFPVEVFNVLGAGDAFMAGFLRGWLRGASRSPHCCAYANACGALVVSRHGCAPAMPSWTELQHFLAHGSPQRGAARGRRARAPAPRHHAPAPTGRSWRCSPSTTASSSRSSPARGADAGDAHRPLQGAGRRGRAARREARAGGSAAAFGVDPRRPLRRGRRCRP